MIPSPPEYWIMFLDYNLRNRPDAGVVEHDKKEHQPRWHYVRGRSLFPSKEIALAAALAELKKEQAEINKRFDQLKRQLTEDYAAALEERAFRAGVTSRQVEYEVKEWLKDNAR